MDQRGALDLLLEAASAHSSASVASMIITPSSPGSSNGVVPQQADITNEQQSLVSSEISQSQSPPSPLKKKRARSPTSSPSGCSNKSEKSCSNSSDYASSNSDLANNRTTTSNSSPAAATAAAGGPKKTPTTIRSKKIPKAAKGGGGLKKPPPPSSSPSKRNLPNKSPMKLALLAASNKAPTTTASSKVSSAKKQMRQVIDKQLDDKQEEETAAIVEEKNKKMVVVPYAFPTSTAFAGISALKRHFRNLRAGKADSASGEEYNSTTAEQLSQSQSSQMMILPSMTEIDASMIEQRNSFPISSLLKKEKTPLVAPNNMLILPAQPKLSADSTSNPAAPIDSGTDRETQFVAQRRRSFPAELKPSADIRFNPAVETTKKAAERRPSLPAQTKSSADITSNPVASGTDGNTPFVFPRRRSFPVTLKPSPGITSNPGIETTKKVATNATMRGAKTASEPRNETSSPAASPPGRVKVEDEKQSARNHRASTIAKPDPEHRLLAASYEPHPESVVLGRPSLHLEVLCRFFVHQYKEAEDKQQIIADMYRLMEEGCPSDCFVRKDQHGRYWQVEQDVAYQTIELGLLRQLV